MKKVLYLLLLMILSCINLYATHIRGGHITYKRLDPHQPTYEITVTGFADTYSPVLFGSNGELDFGDGTVEFVNNMGDHGWIPRSRISDGTWKYELKRIHTYPENKSYQISFRELYRNEGVWNMSNSVNMPFYIESLLIVSDQFINNSVYLPLGPQIIASLNQTYYFNPKAFDPDNDSLSYHLVPVRQAKNEVVANYRLPHKALSTDGISQTGEKAYFIINPITGDLVWDSPNEIGEYNYAYEVVEWRKIMGKYVMVGKVVQDMQLIVESHSHPQPQMKFPVEQQVVELEKGESWELTIEAIAESPNDSIVLLLSGDLLKQKTTIIPADSTGGRGKASITIQYTPEDEENVLYQLIASTFTIEEDPWYGIIMRTRPINRSVFLSVNYQGTRPDEEELLWLDSATEIKQLKCYPNPTSTNSFILYDENLAGKNLSVSLFSLDGMMVYHQTFKYAFGRQRINPDQRLEGYYILMVRQEENIYTSRILFYQ